MQVVSRRPISLPPKHFERCTSLVWKPARCNSGWGSSFVAVRKHRSRASAQAGFIRPLRPGQHWGLRPSFALRALAWQAIYASLQQHVDFFCKEIVPGQHRWEAPFEYSSGEWLRGNSRPRRSRVCEPWRCKSSLAHQFQESKPQQTGTGLLIRFGEVATTSGSTNSLPGQQITAANAGERF